MVDTIPTRVPPGQILALGALSSFGPLALVLYLPSLPTISADLHTTQTATQLTLSACMAGLALGQILVGPLSDRFGRSSLLILSVAVFAATSALCAVAPSIEVLLVLRLVGGMGGGAGIVIARSMARDLYTGIALARTYARLMLISGVAPVLAPLLGGQLLRITDWRGLFATLAVIGLLLLVTAIKQVETLPAHRRRATALRDTGRDLHHLVRDRMFLLMALVLASGLCAMFTYIAMGSYLLEQVYGFTPQEYTLVTSGSAVGIMLFAQAGAVLVRRLGTLALLSCGVYLALTAAGAMLFAVLSSGPLDTLLVPLFILVACTGLISPNATALALDRQGERAGSAAALLGLGQFGMAAVVPPLASLGGISAATMAATAMATTATAAVALACFSRGSARLDRPTAHPTSAHQRAGHPGTGTSAGQDGFDDGPTLPLRPTPPTPREPQVTHRLGRPPSVSHEPGHLDEEPTRRGMQQLLLDESRRREWRRIAERLRHDDTPDNHQDDTCRA